jgi:HTH-type transcriptional regulator/antitoxin PezA
VVQLRASTLDLTQQDFADRLGTTRNNIAGYEIGRRAPSVAVITLICKTFNVSEVWLRTGEGAMFIERSETAELAAAVERLITGESADFKRRLINALSTLKDEHWILLEKKMKEIVGTQDATSTFSPAPSLTIEEEARAEAEEYYRAILAEKEAAAGLSASSDSISGAKLA